jgi:hypothetical protein
MRSSAPVVDGCDETIVVVPGETALLQLNLLVLMLPTAFVTTGFFIK